MKDNRDLRKFFCGLIYIFIIIVVSKYADLFTKGTTNTVVGKLSSNIANIRISKISDCYNEEINNETASKQKEIYVEKVYKKLLITDTTYTYIKNNNQIKTEATSNSTINASQIKMPNFGEIFARISIPSCSINTNVVFGLTQSLIDNYDVAAQDCLTSVYVDPMLPGYGRPLLFGGHNYKSFSRLKNINIGDQITVSTNYGVFYYTVTEAKLAKLNVHGTSIVDISTGRDLINYYGSEELQMYTCNSLNSNDTNRFFVRARKTGGTKIIF